MDSTADGAGNCAVAGQCTLRAAIQAANVTPERDVVRVPAGTYEFTGQDLIVTMNDQVDVIGEGARTTVLREVSGGDGRVFLLEQNSAMALSGVTLTGAQGASAVLLFGGGIDFRATEVTFTGNTAPNGGAVDGTGGAVTLDRSTLAGNTATGKGGAVYVGGAASTLEAVNTTITGNSAPDGAGVYVDSGTATLTHVTLADRLFDGHRGDRARPGCVRRSWPAARAHRRSRSASTSSRGRPAAWPARAIARAPILRSGPFRTTAGSTWTRAPAFGSPAVDAASGCPPPATDQRGIARPQLSLCDIGAVELVPPPAPPPPAVIGLRLTPSTFRAAVSGASLAARGRAPVGSRLRFRLSARSTVRFTLRRTLAGRRAGARCVKPTPANRRARRCTRLVALRGAEERTRSAGSVSLRFRGRWRGTQARARRLSPVRGGAGARSRGRRLGRELPRRPLTAPPRGRA